MKLSDYNGVTGTLKYVIDYTGFSSNTEEQSGYYLAIKVDVNKEADVTVELVGGTKGPVELDEDMNAVVRVTDKEQQSLKIVANDGVKTVTKIYDLSNLVLDEVAG